MAGEQRVETLLDSHPRIGIDTMAFIYFFEANETYRTFTHPLFSRVESGRNTGVTSTLTLMEILVKPIMTGNKDLAEDYKYILTTFPNLTLRKIDSEVAERAAELRARHKLKPPDALQLAATMAEGATAFITNDEEMREIAEVETILMRDYV